ncbi:MAG: FAD-dependent oxidoreductase [Lentisphaerae bacterium]|nr:FAD-dependent oxidoreductase [Lentisphaerota bacterium]
MTDSPTAWRCTVCGYVHQGAEPPEFCPVCGALPEEFEPYDPPQATLAASVADQWRCLNCDYVHEGAGPPDECPVCGAPARRFEPVQEAAGPVAGIDDDVRILVIGAGIAGVSAAETVRDAAPASHVTLLSQEPRLPYYRLNLTRYLAGEIDMDSLPIHPRGWYGEKGIELKTGVDVDDLSPGDGTVTLKDGNTISFDRAILATGSHPFVPPIPGAELNGVTTLRTATDAERILESVAAGRKCVCIGGGILGLETAGALARRGVDVTLLESHDWLMPRQLNRKAAGRLTEYLENIGIKLLGQAQTREITGTSVVESVVLQGGDTVEAGLVILATGVRSNTRLARKAGIEVNRGILVDNHLRTSHPAVFAAGDAAEHNGVVYGAWAASQFQGSIAGLNALGIDTPFGGLPRSNALKVLGLDLLSIGQFEPEDGSYLVLDHEEGDDFAHFVFHDGKMVGAILLGYASLAPSTKKMVEQKLDCSALVTGRPSGQAVVKCLARRS